jgi:hypothetical protein
MRAKWWDMGSQLGWQMWEEEDQQDQFRSGQVNGPGFKDGTAMAVKVTIAQWAIAVFGRAGQGYGEHCIYWAV